jgi:hypothetical protein
MGVPKFTLGFASLGQITCDTCSSIEVHTLWQCQNAFSNFDLVLNYLKLKTPPSHSNKIHLYIKISWCLMLNFPHPQIYEKFKH